MISRLIIVLVLTLVGVAPSVRAQQNLFDHVFWQANGNREAQGWGGEGMDTIGFVNATIPHAISVGEAQTGKNVSSFVYNRFKLDSARHWEFPGVKTIRGDFNNDGKFDLVCWDKLHQRITIWYGTAKIDSFYLAATLQDSGVLYQYLDNCICVVDCDSDGYDDLVVSDELYSFDNNASYVGRVQWFRGGPSFDINPAQTIFGKSRPRDYVGGFLRVGAVRDPRKKFLAEFRTYAGGAGTANPDTARIVLYPLGSGFSLTPKDTVTCVLDTSKYWGIQGDFEIIDIDNDSIGDFLFPAIDLHFQSNRQNVPTVFAFKGGPGKLLYPDFLFHCPFETNSDRFGTKIIDIGDVTGRGEYHSLLITDPQAYQNDAGAVFLFDMGAALKDSCVASASGRIGSFDKFGIQAVGTGDISGDRRADFAVGSEADDDVNLRTGVGTVTMFLGDSSYGPSLSDVMARQVLPLSVRLEQNYPNPFNETTDITFVVNDSKLFGHTLTLSLYDMLGRKLADLYEGAADGYGYTVRMNGTSLPAGAYLYRLVCGSVQRSCIMSISK